MHDTERQQGVPELTENESLVTIARSRLGTRSTSHKQVHQLQEEKDAVAEELHGPVERPRVRQRVSLSHILDVVPPMPTLIPHNLSMLMQERGTSRKYWS